MMPADLRPPLDVFVDVFGIQATVTPKGGSPVDTIVIWESTVDPLRVRSAFLAGAGELVDPRPTLNILRRDVAALPIGSTVTVAAVTGGDVRTWLVDEIQETDPEVFRAIVH